MAMPDAACNPLPARKVTFSKTVEYIPEPTPAPPQPLLPPLPPPPMSSYSDDIRDDSYPPPKPLTPRRRLHHFDPSLPPCVPSDDRPAQLFGSVVAAEAVGAASRLENCVHLVESQGEVYLRELEVAKMEYKEALGLLDKCFPGLGVASHLPAERLHEGLSAHAQDTRPCPCGAGRLARWPWVLHMEGLGFCTGEAPEGWPSWAQDDMDDVHNWEMICWRSEWISASPRGGSIPW